MARNNKSCDNFLHVKHGTAEVTLSEMTSFLCYTGMSLCIATVLFFFHSFLGYFIHCHAIHFVQFHIVSVLFHNHLFNYAVIGTQAHLVSALHACLSIYSLTFALAVLSG